MATNNVYAQGTLLDVMNQIGPDGNIMASAEILQKQTPMFKDAKWKEANSVTQHKYSIDYSLPTSTIVQFNKGSSSSLGTTKPAICTLQGRENRPEIDVRLIKISPDGETYLASHAKKSIMGLGQDLEADILYGSIAGGDEYDGIAVRLNALSGNTVFGNGDTGSNLSSIYVVAWDLDIGAYLAYPKGTMAGIKFTDEGERLKDQTDGTTLKVHTMHVEVFAGLCVPDPRALGRIANIDTGAIAVTTFDENLLIQLIAKMAKGVNKRDIVIYASSEVMAAIDIRANDKGNANYTVQNVFGEDTTMFRGHPIRESEIISNAETVVA